MSPTVNTRAKSVAEVIKVLDREIDRLYRKEQASEYEERHRYRYARTMLTDVRHMLANLPAATTGDTP